MAQGNAAGSGAATIDAVVVGAGFGGLYMLHRLTALGFSVRGIEAGAGVGGTWFWNRYPGARCDVESLEYSYAFSTTLLDEWTWTERYASQPEILRYLEHVAARFDLKRLIDFETTVVALEFDERSAVWHVQTSAGGLRCRYCIMATGCLSVPHVPHIPGLDSFRGDVHHTGRWPRRQVSFAGQRVGVIGTGSSAIQSVPVIAEAAEKLVVFQRTPNYSVPARNHPLDPDWLTRFKPELRAFRRRQRATAFGAGQAAREQSALTATPDELIQHYDERWAKGGLTFVGAFSDLLTDMKANETAADYVRTQIRRTVQDAATAARLCPDHAIGCKRLCSDSGYYEAFNRGNVELVDVREAPIEGATPDGIRAGTALHELDMIILACGFDAMTGALDRIHVVGRDGRVLKDQWRGGAGAYLGLAMSGFPNLFVMTGPGSPSVLANMVTGLEQHAEWISACLRFMRGRGLITVEALPEAESQWMAQVNEAAAGTVFPSCNSWYVGANVPGKARVFLPYIGGFDRYEAFCDLVASRNYDGFMLG
jgi:cyclohexanone monooxygenase